MSEKQTTGAEAATAPILTVASSAPIDADDSEPTSDYASTVNTSFTQSITSSVTDYVFENGRRYHAYQEGKYTMPNDETEQDRLDLHHVHMVLLGGALHVAPIKEVHNVLDCGTGTGIWSIMFAEDHPEAVVLGVDLSPIQPKWVTPNVKFEVDDLELPWTFPVNHFDFIYSKYLNNSIKSWSAYLSQMYTHLKPGGYVEISELDMDLKCNDSSYAGSKLEIYMKNFTKGAHEAGLRFWGVEETTKMLEENGFVDIKRHTFYQPYGAWPKDKKHKYLGATVGAILESGFAAYGMALFTRTLGMTKDEAQKICDEAWAEVISKKVHAFQEVWILVARKPEDA